MNWTVVLTDRSQGIFHISFDISLGHLVSRVPSTWQCSQYHNAVAYGLDGYNDR